MSQRSVVDSIIQILSAIACCFHNEYASADCVTNGIEVIGPPFNSDVAELPKSITCSRTRPVYFEKDDIAGT